MSSESSDPPAGNRKGVLLGAALLVVVLGGAIVMSTLAPQHQQQQQQHSPGRPARPIVQIVREQPGLPDLADLIDRLCPSVAVIVPRGADVPAEGNSARAWAYSSDGWLVTSASALPPLPIDALFGDGRRVELSDLRTDPVSGLAIVKSTAPAAPLAFNDQSFPRVGQFGFALATRAGTGCSAAPSMIGSDFLADGGGPVGYVRLRPPPDDWSAGTPLIGSDGRVVGIGLASPGGALVPAPVASTIFDELIRDSVSASTRFGFRAIDFTAPFSSRLGDVRAGAGVALVQPKYPADRAGLRAGDIVTAVDGEPVSSASELSRALDAVPDKAVLGVHRRSQQLSLTLKRIAGK